MLWVIFWAFKGCTSKWHEAIDVHSFPKIRSMSRFGFLLFEFQDEVVSFDAVAPVLEKAF